MSHFRNRSLERFFFSRPELIALAKAKKMKKTKRPTFFSATPVEREKAAVRACGHLHIPPTTLLKFTIGNTVKDIQRQYVDCAGFRLSNAFPDNIVEMTSGEVVYVERFTVHTRSETLFLVGRQFHQVSKNNLHAISFHYISFPFLLH